MPQTGFLQKILNLISERERRQCLMKPWDSRYKRAGRTSRTSDYQNKRLILKIRKILDFLSGQKLVEMLTGKFFIFQQN